MRTPQTLFSAATAAALAAALAATTATSSTAAHPAASTAAETAAATVAATAADDDAAGRTERSRRDTLTSYAHDTWRSMAAMTDPATGLVADNVDGSLRARTRSGYTSPTNIGASLWSTVVARELGFVSDKAALQRMRQTIRTVAGLERHRWSGMFYNWYSPSTGEKLTTWPVDGSRVKPFLSSVDNAWLATGLLLTARAEPRLADRADTIRERMDFGFFYNPAENQIRGGFWDEDPDDPAAVVGNYRDRGPDVWYTGHHYGAFNTEPRMASYLGIAGDQIPAKHYFGTFRTFPGDSCDWSWTETQGVGEWRTYLGQRVFEGAYPYRGAKIVPTWGGSMFEALMVPLFVPEEQWGRNSWRVTHPLYVRAQIQHGLREADYGYWGFSPSNDPAGGYREYGVDQLGMEPTGYTSDEQRTSVDQPYGDCEGREGSPAPTEYGDGVVTPHASFLALRYAPSAALANLGRLRRHFDAYGPGGFYDAINVGTGQVSKKYLSLDQGMVLAALGNALAGDAVRDYVSPGTIRSHLRPLMVMEEFGAAPRAPR